MREYRNIFVLHSGQALITLLFFMIIAINVTAAAVVVILVNSLSGTKFQQGSLAYEIAQTGVDNAKIRLLRNPEYPGEVLAVDGGTATITVAKTGSQYTIISTGTIGNFTRQIQLMATYSANLLTVYSQKEVF